MEEITVTAATEIARALKTLGVRKVFGLCADQINNIYDALLAADIEIVSCRQESAALHMADGWARASGEPGVALVGGGPGFINSVTGFAVAQSAATPVIVISGQPPLDTRERNGHQILHQADIVRTLTKWSQEVVSPGNAAEFVSRGFGIATAGKPGPVNLSVPTDVLDAKAPHPGTYRVVRHDWRTQDSQIVSGGLHEELARLVNAAKRPVLIVGGGAWWELDRDTLASAIEATGIPVFTTELARGLIPDDGKSCFGYAHPAFSRTFREIRSADLLIFAGTEVNLHTGALQKSLIAKDTKIVQLHRDPLQIGIGRSTDLAIIGPLALSLRAMAQNIDHSAAAAHRSWLTHIQKSYAGHRTEWQELARTLCTDPDLIHPLQVCLSMQRHYSERTRVVIDGGDFVHWPRLYFEAKTPGYWMDGAEIGALGTSLPVGIGAQMGQPAGQTWVFIGDGGFGFYAMDLSTAAEQGVNVKIIVGNDRCWGVERRLQLKHYGRTVGVDLPNIQYDELARVLGAKGVSVTHPRDLDRAVDELVGSEGPCVLNVAIQRDAGRPLMN